MIISSKNKERVLEGIKKGLIDKADLSFPNLIDDIVLTMKRNGLLEILEKPLPDKRRVNKNIPFHLLLTLFVTAKMKIMSGLSDVPFAITSAEMLSEIGWNIWDNERDLEEGLMTEGALRNVVGKYKADELVPAYNTYVQDYVFPAMNIEIQIHILDCTELEVELDNANYENSGIVKKDGVRRGYKLSTLRGITGDTGVIEEIELGAINENDLALSRDMVKDSKMLKPGDILINDRGFISRDFLNELKTSRGVDVYIPLKKNMDAYEMAVSIAKKQKWEPHPNKKRKKQKITFVSELGNYWISDNPEEDVEVNACVVHDTADGEYYVFVTTDLKKDAKQIIKTYELRPEIEEDYRQIKDFWKIEDFKSTKYNFITFHIIMVLIGYLFYQLYTLMDEGKKYSGKSLPVAIKKHVPSGAKTVTIYAGNYFAVFGFLEFIQLYESVDMDVKALLNPVLAKV